MVLEKVLQRTVPALGAELNQRQKTVLKEVCDTFISTGVPVGSRTISRRNSLAISPATIRNEMADLELLGYLFSPHTSAGRVPTEKGYRFYVNFLVQFSRVNRIEQQLMSLLSRTFEERHHRIDEVLRSAIRVATEQTKLGGLILVPARRQVELASIQLHRILEDKAMLIMVDQHGNIADELVPIPADTDDEILARIAHLLNVRLCERRRQEHDREWLRRSQELLERYNELLNLLTQRVASAMANPGGDAIFLDGFVNFFEQPEFNEPGKMRRMISLLDQKEALLKILARTLESEEEIMVNIGSEAGLAMDDLSIVTARYHGPAQSIGRIGLIGPLRMDYSRVVATLGHISQALTRLFVGPDISGTSEHPNHDDQ
jgi:heat-inducible transcriptional repressor